MTRVGGVRKSMRIRAATFQEHGMSFYFCQLWVACATSSLQMRLGGLEMEDVEADLPPKNRSD